jgi:hypothetical protein
VAKRNKMDGQLIVALSIVALSAAYVGYRCCQVVAAWGNPSQSSSSCGGCQGCAHNRVNNGTAVVLLQAPKQPHPLHHATETI